MKEESSLENENNENERILKDAKYLINAMWKKAIDVSDLPLSVDPSYQVWTEDLERRKNDFARVLFNRAREVVGEEKLHSAQTLQKLMKLLNSTSRQEILKELMTTEEALEELVNRAEQQIRLRQ